MKVLQKLSCPSRARKNDLRRGFGSSTREYEGRRGGLSSPGVSTSSTKGRSERDGTQKKNRTKRRRHQTLLKRERVGSARLRPSHVVLEEWTSPRRHILLDDGWGPIKIIINFTISCQVTHSEARHILQFVGSPLKGEESRAILYRRSDLQGREKRFF